MKVGDRVAVTFVKAPGDFTMRAGTVTQVREKSVRHGSVMVKFDDDGTEGWFFGHHMVTVKEPEKVPETAPIESE